MTVAKAVRVDADKEADKRIHRLSDEHEKRTKKDKNTSDRKNQQLKVKN